MAFRHVAVAFSIAYAIWLPMLVARAEPIDPDAIAAARELIELTVSNDIQNKIVDQSWPAMEPVVRKAAPQIDENQMSSLKETYMQILSENMKMVTAQFPDLYAKYFSAQEIRDLLVFYRTPVGKKMVEVTPALGGDLMQIMMPQMPAMSARINEAFVRVLKDKGITLPGRLR